MSFQAEPTHPTATFTVTNCEDAGTGSLRDAVAQVNLAGVDAAIGFDLQSMQCSRITLKTGEIQITTPNVMIGGPGAAIVTIDGGLSLGYKNRIFKHTGQGGVLHLDHLALTDAHYTHVGSASGGCVISPGTVYLSDSSVDGCRVSSDGTATGGGIWTRKLQMIRSVVSHCAVASEQGFAAGGGIYLDAYGATVKQSTISNNIVISYGAYPISAGGGIFLRSVITIENSTLWGNQAGYGGALESTQSIYLVNSTVAFNDAWAGYGGTYTSEKASIYNSTIAFNISDDLEKGVGLHAGSIYAESSIIANNVYYSSENAFQSDVYSNDGHITGHHDLINAAPFTSVPQGTISTCARLAPLLDNGGRTLTVALLPGSPAIDAGDDPFTLGSDQRGPGFPRVVGALADIGAYESSPGAGEIINRNGFEKCD